MPIQNAFVKFTYIPRAQYTALTKDANTYYAVVETDGKLRYYLGSTEFSYLPLTGGTLTDDLMMALADGADPRPSKNILFQGRIGGTPYTKALNMGADGILKFNGTAISLDGHTHGSYNRATSALTGANVFSDIVVSNGIVTGTSTRALTASDIGAAAASHAHGYITVDGLLTSDDTLGNGDKLLFSDSSNGGKITAMNLSIATVHNDTYLRRDGTWSTPINTLNTAGATDISTKIYLIGAGAQTANPQTYSDDEVFITSGVLTAKQLTLTIANGTAPMTITSATRVVNLNADLLDGYHYNNLPYRPDTWVPSWSDISGTVPAPTSLTTVESGDHVVITFTRSTGPVEGYEVYSSVGDETNYSLISVIKDTATTGSISIDDNTYVKNGLIYYKVFAVYKGNTSAAASSSVLVSNSVADVSNVSVVQGVGTLILTFDLPEDRRLDSVNIYVDYETTEGALAKPASPVFSGKRSLYVYYVPDAYLTYYHKFWIDTITRT